jgi:hypothetical protein
MVPFAIAGFSNNNALNLFGIPQQMDYSLNMHLYVTIAVIVGSEEAAN